MIKLHYAELTNDSDIPCFEFKSKEEFIDFLGEKSELENRVFLFAYEFKELENVSEVFVTEDLTLIHVIMDNCFGLIQSDNVFFLQEYPSFEDAYKVALDMQETSKLCYNQD